MSSCDTLAKKARSCVNQRQYPKITKTRVKDRHYEQPVCIKIAAPG